MARVVSSPDSVFSQALIAFSLRRQAMIWCVVGAWDTCFVVLVGGGVFDVAGFIARCCCWGCIIY